MSNTGLAPVTIMLFSENIHTTLLIASTSQIPASAVTFSQAKGFSHYWEGETRWFIVTGEKRCVPSPHTCHVKGQTWLETIRWDTVFMSTLFCSARCET